MYIKPNYFIPYKDQTITCDTMRDIEIAIDSIKFDSRIGRWSAITIYSAKQLIYDSRIPGKVAAVNIGIFGLFEHDTYGDLTDHVLAYFDWYSGDNNWKEIAGTYDGVEIALIDESVIESEVC